MMYYIFVYCGFTLLIPLIDKLAKSKYKYLGFLITPAEIIIMRSFPIFFGYEINKYVSMIMSISCLAWFTYYYIGYLLGNKIIKIKFPTNLLVVSLVVSIILQITEAYMYYLKQYANCGTQLKLSAILTGTIAVILAYKYIYSSKQCCYIN